MPQPEAATLATVAADGRPQARTVLVKSFAGGKFVFFTNRESRKGEALRENPRAALLFYWPPLGRQANIEGDVAPISRRRTAAYFASRPPQSQISAWASAQSRPVESPAAFAAQVQNTKRRFAGRPPSSPPPYWSGYALSPLRMEFWQEGEHRLHHRLEFSREAPGRKWRAAFLQP
ncbi:MAG: pyridoxamine 5'-phosphate oxidase [Gammaproteobacteria bacterium]